VILGSKREEVTGNWTELPTEELYNLYSLLNTNNHQSKVTKRITCNTSVEKPEGKRSVGGHRLW
jgi:hypothetical protein